MLSGADAYHILHVGNKDLAVAHGAGGELGNDLCKNLIQIFVPDHRHDIEPGEKVDFDPQLLKLFAVALLMAAAHRGHDGQTAVFILGQDPFEKLKLFSTNDQFDLFHDD